MHASPLTMRQRSISSEEEEKVLYLTPEITQLRNVLQNFEEEKTALYLELRATRQKLTDWRMQSRVLMIE